MAIPRTKKKRTIASGIIVATLLGLAPAGAALRPAPLRAALGRTLGLPLAALLRGRLPARGTSLRRHGSNDSGLRVQHNCFELQRGEARLQPNNVIEPTQPRTPHWDQNPDANGQPWPTNSPALDTHFETPRRSGRSLFLINFFYTRLWRALFSVGVLGQNVLLDPSLWQLLR